MARPTEVRTGGPSVIFNADDFGRSPAINAAIIRAHREGVLTSASLMVAGEAADEAVALARATPSLAVGLHVVVIAGRAVLPAAEIPHLVDSGGRFPGDAFRLGLRYVFSGDARAELACELAAQFERFAVTGLPLSHVDGHAHMHLHPTVWNLLLPLAERYGACGVRVPRDDLQLAWRYRRRRRAAGGEPRGLPSHGAGPGLQAAWAVTFGLLCRWCMCSLQARRSRGAHSSSASSGCGGLVYPQRVFGLMQTGQMEEAYVLQVLASLDGPAAEIYFHPTTAQQPEPLGPNAGDLATLLSPAVRRAIDERHLHLAQYAHLAREAL